MKTKSMSGRIVEILEFFHAIVQCASVEEMKRMTGHKNWAMRTHEKLLCDIDEAKKQASSSLIAAAPELLEACTELKKIYSEAVGWMLDRELDSDKWPKWMTGCRTILEVAEAAIAKAKGE